MPQDLCTAHVLQVQVPVRTLDGLIPGEQHVLMLKVDTQGFDYRVLLGAARPLLVPDSLR